jgi:hypothetical protein
LEIKIDDIFAALMLSLIMMRRIEVKSTEASQNPTVEVKQFEAWKTLGLRAGVGFPWFQLGGFAIFVSWAIALIWAWKIATDARHMRLSLGIQVRRRASTTRSSSGGSTP